MWNAIVELFQRLTLINKVTARRQFYSVKMTNGERIMSYINRVRHLAANLKEMESSLSDQDLSMTVLSGLSSRFEHLIVAIDAAAYDSKLTMDFAKSRLLQEEQRMTYLTPEHSSRDSALVNGSSNK